MPHKKDHKPPVPHNRGMRPDTSLSAGGWLGLGSFSAGDAAKFGFNAAKGLVHDIGTDLVGTTIDAAKSIAGTATRLDDYGVMIQNNYGGRNDTRRLEAIREIRGRGLEDVINIVGGVSGARLANSPAGRLAAYNARHAVGQSSLVGQPARTAILRAEARHTWKKAKEIEDRLPSRSVIRVHPQTGEILDPSDALWLYGRTQVRNLHALHSPESWRFYDQVEKYSGLQTINKSPNMIADKLAEAQDPASWTNRLYPTTLYEKIRREGLDNLPEVTVGGLKGRTVVYDGHHRVVAANKLNPKQQGYYGVSAGSFDPLNDPFHDLAKKLEVFNINAKAKRNAGRNPEGIRPQPLEPVNVSLWKWSPGTKQFLNKVTPPTSKDLAVPFRTSQLPTPVWETQIKKYGPRSSGSRSR